MDSKEALGLIETKGLVASIEATPEPGCVRLSIRATVPAGQPASAKAPSPDANRLMQHLLASCGPDSVLRAGRVDLARYQWKRDQEAGVQPSLF